MGSPPASLLTILGVLRSTATRVSADSVPQTSGNSDLYVNSIRRARSAFGSAFYLYVAGGLRLLPCPFPPVGAVLASTGGGGVHGPISAAQIEQGEYSFSADGGQTSAIVSGVVPDGVATVTFSYKAGPSRGFSKTVLPAVTINASVVNNVVVARVPRAAPNALKATVRWRSAHGSVIKTITL